VHKVITSATIINLLSEEFSVVISDHSFWHLVRSTEPVKFDPLLFPWSFTGDGNWKSNHVCPPQITSKYHLRNDNLLTVFDRVSRRSSRDNSWIPWLDFFLNETETGVKK
jgi:hypothetical protein